MIERYALALSAVSIDMIAEDLQRWTTAYKEDKGHVAAYVKLHQGQKCEVFYLTPLGQMARIKGVRHKIIVPTSLQQQILKECHDVPFIGHVGMCKTLKLVNRLFHWRGLQGNTI